MTNIIFCSYSRRPFPFLRSLTRCALTATLATTLAGCGSSGGTADVTLSMASSVTAFSVKALTGTETPTEFKVRLKSIYLVEDQESATSDTNWVGDNIGQTGQIWAPSDCPLGSSDAACATIAFFDLARSTSLVNADLNASATAIEAGTYRYVKLTLVGDQQGSNNTYQNIQWNSAGAGSTQTFASIPTELGAKFDTPLELTEGDAVTVTLNYDLTGIVDTGLTGAQEMVAGQGTNQPGKYPDCVGGTTCLNLPPLTVTVTKQ